MLASSAQARVALSIVEQLQQRFIRGLEAAGAEFGDSKHFETHRWQRDGGVHGGGQRAAVASTSLFGRASVNVSQVHYDDLPDKRLRSATALSTIIHPQPPKLPSVHIHISYTELRNEPGYWRMMADLNPAVENTEHKTLFAAALQTAAGSLYEEAEAQGDKYFYIPALGRHRGVTHFYLEGYNSSNFEADAELAKEIGDSAIDAYNKIIMSMVRDDLSATEEERALQLEYHTLYFFQVLTLDRGTTSGLMVHNQNDVGILGSLPPVVDRELLLSWRSRLAEPQNHLVDQLVDVLADKAQSEVGDAEKIQLAQRVREHYTAFPDALALQASGHRIPPTVANHRSPS